MWPEGEGQQKRQGRDSKAVEEKQRERQGRTSQRAGQEKQVKGSGKSGRELESNTQWDGGEQTGI